MADVVNIGQRVSTVEVAPQFQPYSMVIIHVDDDTTIVAGDESGRVMEMDNPFGSQQMANNILARLRGLQYQPYQADGALLDPAAEIGDAVGTATSYGGLYTRSRKFGRLMKADISAPHDEEINHEYKYESPQERKFTRVTGEIKASIILTNTMIQSEVIARQDADNAMSSRITQTANSITAEVQRATAAEGQMSSLISQNADSISAEVIRATAAEGTLSSRITQNANGITAEVSRATQAEGTLRSSLSVQASQIEAKVSSSGGGSSFSWVLDSSSHTWKSNGADVMRISASGLWLKGAIEAQSGKIGGFDIGANALSYNGLNWGDTDKNFGAYIGQSGIQLGKNFRVDTGGNVRATNMTLAGTLTFLNSDGTPAGSMSAADLRIGAQQSYNNYSSWNSTTGTVNSNSGYWNGGAYYGYGYGNATDQNSGSYPAYFRANVIRATNVVWANQLQVGAYYASWQTKTISGTTIHYLGW